ncbi:MAG: hypothetical protein V2A63_03230 [Patescibacteria group bacterium]
MTETMTATESRGDLFPDDPNKMALKLSRGGSGDLGGHNFQYIGLGECGPNNEVGFTILVDGKPTTLAHNEKFKIGQLTVRIVHNPRDGLDIIEIHRRIGLPERIRRLLEEVAGIPPC